jgi:adenine C2-methylase RlmN of 23S rRNA A2503 and tRNA A37
VAVSMQVGCAMGCKFCATGTMGLRSQLTAGEILEQVWHARRVCGEVKNVVFMGMGEVCTHPAPPPRQRMETKGGRE